MEGSFGDRERPAERLSQFWSEQRAGSVLTGATVAVQQSASDFGNDVCGELTRIADTKPALARLLAGPFDAGVRPGRFSFHRCGSEGDTPLRELLQDTLQALRVLLADPA